MKNRYAKILALVILVLVVDQCLKIWVKTSFVYREDRAVFGDWFILQFIENNGFAFGMELGGKWGKLGLSLFRLIAVSVIGFYVWSLIKEVGKKVRMGYVFMVALVFAGAVGNIIDSVFYGVIFSESTVGAPIATLFPDGGGYAPLFFGRVVDMLYFPIYSDYLPEWVPFVGGDYFEFFRPVFNIADSAISIGVIGILIFYRKELKSFK